MKILLVNKYHYLRGGDCKYFFELSEMLKKEGHEVRHFSMHHEKNIPVPEQTKFVTFIDFPDELKKKGAVPKIKTFLRILYSKEAREKFREILNEFKPDVIHLNNIHKHLTTSIILEANKRHIPIVWTLHDYNLICPNISFLSDGKICETCKKYRHIGPVLKKCSNDSFSASAIISAESILHKVQNIEKKINYFISPSVFLKQKFVEYGFNHNKIKVLPNFISVPETEIQSKHFENNETQKKYFLYLGRISLEKGIETLCMAAQDAGINLLIAGAGPLKEEFEFKYSSEKIKFLGFKSGNELEELKRNAWFTVIPSEWYENNPFSIIETFSYGVPAIGANIGGIPELIINSKTGYLFEPGSAGTLKLILQHAENLSNETRNSMGANAKLQVRTSNNPSAYYHEILDIYNRAIAEERPKWKHLLQ